MRASTFVFGVVAILFAVSTLRGEPDKASEKVVAKEVEKDLYGHLQQYGNVGGSQVGYEIWVQEMTNHRLIQPLFIRLNTGGGNDYVITAKEAELKVNTEKSQLEVRMREAIVSARDGTKAYFRERTLTVPLPVSRDDK